MSRGKRSEEIVSYTMSRIKSSGTSIERIMSSALWDAGLRGYRKNKKDIIGKPDFSWPKYKFAVFCDSAFWHGYKNMTTKIHAFKRRKSFWTRKIERNIARDKEVNVALRKAGWKVIRFWDFQILKNPDKCVEKIDNQLKKRII